MSTAPELDEAAEPRRHWRVFSIVAAAVFMASMDGGMVPVVFHGIHDSFRSTASTTLAWVFTAYTMALASFVVLSGRLADRTGRKRMFLLGGATFVVGSGLCALAPTAGLLIAARFVEGTGHALFTPASLGLILAAWPAARRTQAIGWWIAVGGIASGLGPTVGAVIAQWSSWRLAFVLNVAIGVPVLWRAWRELSDTEHLDDTRLPDPVGNVLLCVALAVLALAIVQGPTWGWGDPKIVGSLAAAVVLGAAFAWRSAHHDSPVLDMALMTRPTYRRSLVISMLVSGSMFANLVMQPQFLQQAWGYSTLKAGLAVTPLPALAGVTAPVAGRIAERYGHRVAILIGISMTTAGLFCYATLPGQQPDYLRTFLPGIVLSGIGTWGFAISMINAAAVSDMTEANFGVGTAILQTARQVAGILGVSVFFGFYGEPAAAEVVGRFHHLWLAFALAPALGFVLALRLRPATGRRPADAAAPAAELAPEPAPSPAPAG